jgi:hypothetical protein
MEQLQIAIEKYNTANKNFFSNRDGYNVLTQYPIATEEEIIQLQQVHNFPLPDSLLAFYKTIGGLYNHDNYEKYCMMIPPASKLISLKIVGIIDAILESWGNDRYEFLPSENYFKEEEIIYLNENYKCFGHYHTEFGYESCGYLYFDKEGNYNELFYHQDNFDEVHETLLNMTKASPASKTLEQVLIDCITGIADSMKYYNE